MKENLPSVTFNDFSSNFRNSLTVIGGLARRLERKLSDPQYKDCSRRIVDDVKKAELILKGGSIMFSGRWDTRLNEEWQLYIPTIINKGFGKFVLLKEKEENGCVMMTKISPQREENLPHIFIEKIKNGGKIKIPDPLRGSSSFYYGKNVTIVGRGDYLEIWPRL